jgi:hypothetical protein
MYKHLDDNEDGDGKQGYFVPGEAPRMVEFFILPTYSYFGDFQILYDLRS